MISRARGLHVNEVTTIYQLQIGKKIRCHYNATLNKVGEFNSLGEEFGGFITVNSLKNPNGDFYFNCVDQSDNKLILIADRVIQNYISAKTIIDYIGNRRNRKEIYFNNYNAMFILSLITGGSLKEDFQNDWDQFLVNNDSKLFPLNEWGLDGPSASWTIDCPKNTKYKESFKLRVARGIGIFNKDTQIGDSYNYWTYGTYTNVNQATGFRPKLTIHLK